jgi:hypothetical protein
MGTRTKEGAHLSRLLISYDLRKPNYTEKDYEKLYAEMERLGAKHIQDSVWAIQSEEKCGAIIEVLKKHMHSMDRLLVARIDGFENVNGITRLSSV